MVFWSSTGYNLIWHKVGWQLLINFKCSYMHSTHHMILKKGCWNILAQSLDPFMNKFFVNNLVLFNIHAYWKNSLKFTSFMPHYICCSVSYFLLPGYDSKPYILAPKYLEILIDFWSYENSAEFLCLEFYCWYATNLLWGRCRGIYGLCIQLIFFENENVESDIFLRYHWKWHQRSGCEILQNACLWRVDRQKVDRWLNCLVMISIKTMERQTRFYKEILLNDTRVNLQANIIEFRGILGKSS